MKRALGSRVGLGLLCVMGMAMAVPVAAEQPFQGHEVQLPENVAEEIAEARSRSMEHREQRLRDTVAQDRDGMFPPGRWGETLWALSALMVEEKVDEANALLLSNAAEEDPFAYFSAFDYMRILCFFGAEGQRTPGLLTAETEAAMKQVVFDWIRPNELSEWGGLSRVDEVTPDHVWEIWGSENHDLIKKTMTYLGSMLLMDDPEYQDRQYDDGHTPAEHYAAMNTYFKHWLRARALHGMWAELGSSTYQKYSYPNLFNLAELSQDAEVRELAKMLLDLSLIEEAQISINNRRGGGKSRGSIGSGLEPITEILFGDGGGSTHTRVIEASAYTPPDIAFILYYHEPVPEPYAIYNRVIGEVAADWTNWNEEEFYRLEPDSALLNHVYRTPHYLMGGVLQEPNRRYAAVSSQQRWAGVVFKDHKAVYPDPEGANGLRWHDAYWGVAHQDVLIVQRTHRAYRTADMRVFFSEGLEKVEEDGWIFADQGDAFIAVRILEGGYVWEENRVILEEDFSPIIIQAGDVDSYDSFTDFRAQVSQAALTVEAEHLTYSSPLAGSPVITFHTNQDPYTLPEIDGTPIELHPEKLYNGPFLQSEFGSGIIYATVGEYQQTFDFRMEPEADRHAADRQGNARIDLGDLLRVVQLYQAEEYHCLASSEDGYGFGIGSRDCAPHHSDYAPQNWRIQLSELLRLVQYYNADGYQPVSETEDGFDLVVRG